MKLHISQKWICVDSNVYYEMDVFARCVPLSLRILSGLVRELRTRANSVTCSNSEDKMVPRIASRIYSAILSFLLETGERVFTASKCPTWTIVGFARKQAKTSFQVVPSFLTYFSNSGFLSTSLLVSHLSRNVLTRFLYRKLKDSILLISLLRDKKESIENVTIRLAHMYMNFLTTQPLSSLFCVAYKYVKNTPFF